MIIIIKLKIIIFIFLAICFVTTKLYATTLMRFNCTAIYQSLLLLVTVDIERNEVAGCKHSALRMF